MNRTLSPTLIAAAACLALTACGGSTKTGSSDATASATATTATTATAASIMTAITHAVPTTRLTITATTANDLLLGKPDQYTSQVAFADSTIPAADTTSDKPGNIALGGDVEVFPNAADAAVREKYVSAITSAMSVHAEHDYLHGNVLIRTSQYLTAAQAAAIDTAAAGAA
jgi:hypothetical protein